ncbi:alpha/beta hydrolase [Schleiferilactobacillus harbinensis]|uniref:alpha/beta hydrolase n=1 Tax=Schleiferilactobacillus harbinensis TaxID=304207 RepID=UPI0021A71B85|nr:alpha/beta hydrolase [Schleiferilactobacillus harbinensis]MCT2907532.1 alpha/beta hydrolase [Schleiferilactobacillus harbinensis]
MQGKRKKWSLRKKLTVIISILVVLFLVVLTGASLYMYNYGFVPGKKDFLSNKKDPVLDRNKRWLAATKKFTWHETAANSNLKLVADYVPAAKATKKTIVVAHGYMGKKEDMANYIRMFHTMGYNVLAPDDRGHGASQGNYAGYGWPDRLDYIKWVKQVIAKDGQQSKISLFGVSMGGATVMFMSGEKLPSQVKAIIEDCGYSSIHDELAYELKELFGLPPFPLINTVNIVAQIRAGYNFDDGDAPTALKKNTRPIFFIHGAKDTFVPTKMVYTNYKAAKQPKQLWVVPGAAHAQSWAKQPKEYQRKVTSFLNEYGQ